MAISFPRIVIVPSQWPSIDSWKTGVSTGVGGSGVGVGVTGSEVGEAVGAAAIVGSSIDVAVGCVVEADTSFGPDTFVEVAVVFPPQAAKTKIAISAMPIDTFLPCGISRLINLPQPKVFLKYWIQIHSKLLKMQEVFLNLKRLNAIGKC